MEFIDIIKELSCAYGIGNINCARETLGRVLTPYAEIETVSNLSLVAKINSGKKKTILLDAHIDEVGMIVTNVDDNGFVSVSACGGIDLRQLPTREVIIHGKKDISGVFVGTPPHLSKGEEKYKDIAEIKIDTALGKKAKEIIRQGDFVTYKPNFLKLIGSRISNKSLDDRIGCAILVKVAQNLKDKELPVNLVLLFSDSEELGLRGARTAVFSIEADEAIAVDVSFGDAPDVPGDKSTVLSSGAMIGVSPTLDRAITRKLEEIATRENIPHTNEVMGGTTGTNADVISVNKTGIKCGLVSVPLRNMHTDCEIIDIKDAQAVVSLLTSYILEGGIDNA